LRQFGQFTPSDCDAIPPNPPWYFSSVFPHWLHLLENVYSPEEALPPPPNSLLNHPIAFSFPLFVAVADER
jgi:hypothetical protein